MSSMHNVTAAYARIFGERSDAQVKAQSRKFAIVDHRPAPLNMSAQEVMDWLEEMRPEVRWQHADEYVIDGVYLNVPEMGRTFGKTLRDAVCLAAAKWEAFNS